MARPIAARSRGADDVKSGEEFVQAGHRQIGADGKDRDQPLALPVLRDEREPAPDAARHVALCDERPSMKMRPVACGRRPMTQSKNSLRPAPIRP